MCVSVLFVCEYREFLPSLRGVESCFCEWEHIAFLEYESSTRTQKGATKTEGRKYNVKFVYLN